MAASWSTTGTSDWSSPSGWRPQTSGGGMEVQAGGLYGGGGAGTPWWQQQGAPQGGGQGMAMPQDPNSGMQVQAGGIFGSGGAGTPWWQQQQGAPQAAGMFGAGNMPQTGGQQYTPDMLSAAGGAPAGGQPWWQQQQGAPSGMAKMSGAGMQQAQMAQAGQPQASGQQAKAGQIPASSAGGPQTQAGGGQAMAKMQQSQMPQQPGSQMMAQQAGGNQQQNQAQPANFNAAQNGGNQAQGISAEDVWKFLSGGLSGGKDGGGLFGGNTNTTIKQEPWAPQGKGLEGLYKKAEEEYARQRALGAPKFAKESQDALAKMAAMAQQPNKMVNQATGAITGITSGDNRIKTGGMFQDMYNAPGINNQSQYNKLYNNGTFTNEQSYKNMAGQNAIGTGRMEDVYGAPGVDTGAYQNILEGTQGAGSLGQGRFGQTAAGGMIDSNPYRESNIKQSMGDTAKMVKASMSKAGRYGSDAYGDAMGKALSSVATQARESGYNQDTANMMAAAQARSGEALARQGIGLQAAGGVAGAQGQNIANRMAAAQSIMGAQGQNAQQQLAALQGLTGMQNLKGQQQLAAAQGLTNLQGMNAAQKMQAAQGLTGVQGQNIANQMQAAGMAPAMNDLRYADMNRLLGIGATKEAMTQQQRDFGWGQLGNLQGTYGNLPGSAGQTTEPGKPWWQNLLGAGMTGLGMFGGMGG